MIVSAAIIILVVALVVTFSLRYRRGAVANRGPLRSIVSREFEIGWTAGTCFLALFLFWWSGSSRSGELDTCGPVHSRGLSRSWRTSLRVQSHLRPRIGRLVLNDVSLSCCGPG